MIQAALKKVLLSQNVETGQITTDAIIFQIPGGPEVFAQATPELVSYIETALGGKGDPSQEPSYQLDAVEESDHLEPAPPMGQPQASSPDERDSDAHVEWSSLPEDILGTHYKLAMHSLGNIAPVLTWRVLEQLVNAIDREFTEEMWAKVGFGSGSPQPSEAPSQATGGLRVNVDVAGNPAPVIVGEDADPGETIADDDDEDAAQF